MQIEPILQSLGIPYRGIEHPAVFTVAESLGHWEDNAPVKNLLLKANGSDHLVLVVMAGTDRLDTRWLASELQVKRFSFASADLLATVLGVTPGSVSLFSLVHPGSAAVEVLVDARLVSLPEVGFHPNDNTQTLFIAGSDIERFLRFTGRTYSVRELAAH